ncbi:hypothetical protein [Saccharopolyspora pogona]|uniref:hypothetical protein n=1 Tax=Saccharopolyspora pogona TaxID=333966 RepID=UPI001688C04F|nr:hypothetical protein [Saccharopolyspora pogona]
MTELTSIFTATPDGVLTNEVGVITGELELRTTCTDDGALRLAIRYVGATEWYTVRGENYRLHDPRDHEVVHRLLVNVLHRPVAS